MRTRVVSAFLGMIFLGLLSFQGLAQQSPPSSPPPDQSAAASQSIRSNVDLVDVLFTVFDRKEKIVGDLSQQDFKVFDDNLPQDIRFFSRQTDLPLRVGMLLDTSNSIRQRLDFEQQAAIDFLFNVIRKEKDQAFLMTVDDDPEVIQGFTGEVGLLRDAIMRQRAGGGTALYDAIYQACEQLINLPQAGTGPALDMRRVLVVISDGEDNMSRHSRGEALEMAQRAGIVIYAISTSVDWILNGEGTMPSQISNPRLHQNEGDRVLLQFSSESGGRVFFPYRIDDLAQSFLAIGDELRSQYSLAYVPTGRTADGKFHTIRIAAAPKGLEVHARKGYFAVAPKSVIPAADVPGR